MGRFNEFAVMAASVLAMVAPSEAILSQNAIERALAMEKRSHHLLQRQLGAMKPVKTVSLTPVVRPDAIRERLYFGPFTIPSKKNKTVNAAKTNQGADTDSSLIMKSITGFCTNCTVLYAKTDTYEVDDITKRATIASGVYNHHILILDNVKTTLLPWYICGGGYNIQGATGAAGLMITGVAEATNWFTSPDGKFNSAYLISGTRQRTYTLNAEMVNYNDGPAQIYITGEVEYLKGVDTSRMDASVSLLSVTGCKSADFRPPHGAVAYNMTSPPTPLPLDGFILASTGHLHDGGTNIQLKLNDQIVCDSKAIYGGPGAETVVDGKVWKTISGQTECNEPIAVKKGDNIVAHAMYDTAKYPLRQASHGHGDGESMGTFFVNFAAKGKGDGAAKSILRGKSTTSAAAPKTAKTPRTGKTAKSAKGLLVEEDLIEVLV